MHLQLYRLIACSLTDGNSTFAWRHWGCVTAKQFHNMKESFEEAEELDGFEDLKPEDQERVKKAFDVGHGVSRVLVFPTRFPLSGSLSSPY